MIIHGYISAGNLHKVLHVSREAFVAQPMQHSVQVGVQEYWEFKTQAFRLSMPIIKSHNTADRSEVLWRELVLFSQESVLQVAEVVRDPCCILHLR